MTNLNDKMIKRYDFKYTYPGMFEYRLGKYVAYSDHLAEVETLRKKLLAFEGMTFSESAELSKLTEQVKDLEFFTAQMNKYTLPGVADTQDSAAKVFKKLTEQNKAMRLAIEHYLEVQKFLAAPDEDTCASSNDFRECLKGLE